MAFRSARDRTGQVRREGGVQLIGGDTVTQTGAVTPAVPEVIEEVVRVEPVTPAANDAIPDGEVVAWLFSPDAEPTRVDVERLPELVRDDANFVWVDLSGYTETQLRHVGGLLDLHRNALRATLSAWQRPSLVVYPDHFLATVTVARLEGSAYRVHAGEVDLIAGNNVLVSAHKLPLPFVDRALARARQSPDLIQMDAAFMLYILLDELLAYYEALNRRVQTEIEGMEERALTDSSDRFLESLIRFKRYAFALSQLVDQHREVFAAFLRPDFTWVSGEDVEAYFRDLNGRLAHLIDDLLEAKDAVNGAFEIYVSQMSHRTNQVIKILTMVSTVLLPATVIIALFGINLESSLHNPAVATPTGFLLMILAVVAVSGSILWGFHRRGWL